MVWFDLYFIRCRWKSCKRVRLVICFIRFVIGGIEREWVFGNYFKVILFIKEMIVKF